MESWQYSSLWCVGTLSIQSRCRFKLKVQCLRFQATNRTGQKVVEGTEDPSRSPDQSIPLPSPSTTGLTESQRVRNKLFFIRNRQKLNLCTFSFSMLQGTRHKIYVISHKIRMSAIRTPFNRPAIWPKLAHSAPRVVERLGARTKSQKRQLVAIVRCTRKTHLAVVADLLGSDSQLTLPSASFLRYLYWNVVLAGRLTVAFQTGYEADEREIYGRRTDVKGVRFDTID